jgi:hypothetical protein
VDIRPMDWKEYFGDEPPWEDKDRSDSNCPVCQDHGYVCASCGYDCNNMYGRGTLPCEFCEKGVEFIRDEMREWREE